MNAMIRRRFFTSIPTIAALLVILQQTASAQGPDVTAPGDPIAGVAATPGSSVSSLASVGQIAGANNYPPLESPPNAIDDTVATKYLNFREINAGFIVTPAAPSTLGGLRFTTANDSPERDPLTVVIEGTDDANATTTLNSPWTTIYNGVSGLAGDPGRNTPGATIMFANAASYRSYRMLVLSVRDGVVANSFQFAEIDLYSSDSGTPFCAGDGSATVCPCANASPVGSESGCLNSLGTGGKLIATGTPSLASDTFTLVGSQMTDSSALYFQGTQQLSGGAGASFGDGLRCVSGAIIRLGVTTNVAGASQYPGVGGIPVSIRGQVGMPGMRMYQVWYRNAAPYCTVSTFNLTNGWTATWMP